MTTKPILVGYDGSPIASAAVDWAMAEAARTGVPVKLAIAVDWQAIPVVPALGMDGWQLTNARQAAESIIQEAVNEAAKAHPDVTVTGLVLDGPPAVVLREQSRHASLVVLGNRGYGGFTQLLLGSTGVAVSSHAHCPVVVVRGEKHPADAPVAVGVDGSACSLLALRYAVEQAADRGVPLHVIRAWEQPGSWWNPTDIDEQAIVAAEQAALDEVLADWRTKFPELTISTTVVVDNPSRALIQASNDAQLVVVGSRGRGGFRGLLLGSVSQQLLHYSHCPVAVIREFPAEEPEPEKEA